jgi:uncharacterized protein
MTAPIIRVCNIQPQPAPRRSRNYRSGRGIKLKATRGGTAAAGCSQELLTRRFQRIQGQPSRRELRLAEVHRRLGTSCRRAAMTAIARPIPRPAILPTHGRRIRGPRAIPFACEALPGFSFDYMVKFGASQSGLTAMSDIDSPAQSPCIRNCCLDDNLICLGCFRSLEEIKEWGVVDDHRRRIILQSAKQRREAGEVSPHL